MFVRPWTLPAAVLGIAVLICWAVELFQLSPFPAAASDRSTIARLAMGSTFTVDDLVTYLFGALLAFAVQFAVRRVSVR